MASISSGEPPILDSRLRGNDGCAKVSLRGNDGGATVSLRGHDDGRVCLRPGVERSRHSGPRAPGVGGRQAQQRSCCRDQMPLLKFCQGLRRSATNVPSDPWMPAFAGQHDGRVCLRPGVERSRHSGPRAGIQGWGSSSSAAQLPPRRNTTIPACAGMTVVQRSPFAGMTIGCVCVPEYSESSFRPPSRNPGVGGRKLNSPLRSCCRDGGQMPLLKFCQGLRRSATNVPSDPWISPPHPLAGMTVGKGLQFSRVDCEVHSRPDGRVCLRPGVERSRSSGPRAGIQGCGGRQWSSGQRSCCRDS